MSRFCIRKLFFRICFTIALLAALIVPNHIKTYAKDRTKTVTIDVVHKSWCAEILSDIRSSFNIFRDSFYGTLINDGVGKKLCNGVFSYSINSTPDSLAYRIDVSPRYKVYYEMENVNIYMRWPVTNQDLEMSKSLSERMGEYDGYYSKLGFVVPKSTAIYIPTKAIENEVRKALSHLFSSLYDPHSDFGTSYALADSNRNSYIFMNPYAGYNSIFDESTMFHERFHLILLETFSPDSILLSDQVINEALADFGSSNFTDSPSMAPFTKGEIRNLEEVPNLDKIEFIEGFPHEPSRLYSFVLWKIRDRVGKERMSQQLLPLLNKISVQLEKINLGEDYKNFVLMRVKRFVDISIDEFESLYGLNLQALKSSIYNQYGF